MDEHELTSPQTTPATPSSQPVQLDLVPTSVTASGQQPASAPADGTAAAPQTPAETDSTAAAAPAPDEVVSFAMPEESYADALRHIRSSNGVSIAEVARKTQMAPTFISDLENRNFGGLPELDQCLAKLEIICHEYDVPATDMVKRFTDEYNRYMASEGQTANSVGSSRSPFRDSISSFRSTSLGKPKRQWYRNLPGLCILIFVLVLAGILFFAFITYKKNQMPDRLDTDLTLDVPLHVPESLPLDAPRR